MRFPADEEWLELADDHRYVISTHGRLYDLRYRCLVKLRLVKPTSGTTWGWSWDIADSRPTRRRGTRKIWAGAAVLRTFVGPGRRVEYKDHNIRNLKLSNLSWRYPDENSSTSLELRVVS